jgi:hypothetical protein
MENKNIQHTRYRRNFWFYPHIVVVKDVGEHIFASQGHNFSFHFHAMKVVERVLEKRIRGQVTIDEMQ